MLNPLSRLSSLAIAAGAILCLAAASQPNQNQGTGIDVRFQGLRNANGVLRLCLSRNPAYYPDCSGDAQARKITIQASRGSYRFDNLPQGTYALTAVHDENSNGELDTFLGIPREGFAFSNNPRIGFGAPSYQRVRFSIGPVRALVRLQFKYIT